MKRLYRRLSCGRLGKAALALAFLTTGGQARADAPPDPAATLERAAALVQSHDFAPATVMLQALLSVDPTNRRAQELLAFAFESMRDVERERRVRSALAAEFPNDPGIQADYGRVLERSGDEVGALRAYRLARKLSTGGPAQELDAAIERMRGRTAWEVGAPLALMVDPAATASRVQAGAAIPCGSRHHLALLATRYAADGRSHPDATDSGVLALSFVRHGAGAFWTGGPRLHVISPRGSARRDVGLGGAITGRAPFGPGFEAEGKAELETPWDEAAVTVLRGGRTTAAEGHLYSHLFSQRLLLQAGARRRRLSILAADPSSTRPRAWESLWLAGADVVVWRPGVAVRGEMLDEALIAPTTLASAATLAYRHYDVSAQTTPEFAARIGLAPRASVDEVSAATTMASPSGHVGLELRAGLAHDAERAAQVWRGAGALVWAPMPATRFELGYEKATEIASGLVGQRRAGWVSFHVDL
jgi:hypothetical protein